MSTKQPYCSIGHTYAYYHSPGWGMCAQGTALGVVRHADSRAVHISFSASGIIALLALVADILQ